MKQVKIVDVAKEAGVSASTVSQYLSGRYKHMSEKTRVRIEEVIKALDYTPNSIARSLKTNKTYTIGVIVFSIAGYFTSDVVRGIDDYCKKHGYNVLIYNTDYDPAIEKKSINMLKTMQVDGIIIASTGHNNDLIASVNAQGLPVVQMYMEFDDLEVDTVISDYKKSAYEATKYLVELNHRDIAVVTQAYKSMRSRHERILGYEAALLEGGIVPKEELIHTWDRHSDLNLLFEQVFNGPCKPTAIFTLHSAITIALLRYCHDNEIKVPEDISVIAFDRLPVADLWQTPITGVEQQTYKLGEESASLMLRKIKEGSNKSVERIELPCELVIRDSCQPIVEEIIE